ncbi:BglG family transcription antiterminator [Enterococcus pallens]|uniref:Uncharacterized protein n=1 Tax=Enterococcus pallens ATCC BAA-351 TaxID=1158607 RepID=R2SCG8_9ENTE|nr:BglG family transcription antiterminator [Enterococcus pallens]EOH93230.1 hypothetical protein UAU_02873 [Enterococcus pallens ATCC BAA-351]EOU25016.1 hypothetical protein I588_01004 [Enterococcus pallens ATCC BAA-351]OJG76111.1 hypothetical protein RV10_GL004221 [Enterococcus pallens]
MLTLRRKNMLNDLKNSSDYISVETFIRKYAVSKRTVYYDISKINEWLRQNQLVPIQYSKISGYYLEEATVEKLSLELTNEDSIVTKFDAEERKFRTFLCLYFSSKAVTISRLEALNSVTKNTVMKDLKTLSSQETIQLSVDKNGHYLNSESEKQTRKFLFRILQQYAHRFHYGLEKILSVFDEFIVEADSFRADVTRCLAIIDHAKSEYGIVYTDEIRYLLSIFAALINIRINTNLIEDSLINEEQTQAESFEIKIAEQLLMTTKSGELQFFETFLISGQLNGLRNRKRNTSIDKELFSITVRIVASFERLSGVYINQKESFLEEFYSHLYGAYYRLIYDIPNVNPILDQLKKEYQDIFTIAKLSVQPLEEYAKRKFSEDEIGFITIYFGGEIKNHVEKAEKKKVILVCASGIGTANLLSIQLTSEVPEINVLGPYSKEEFTLLEPSMNTIDLVLSTIHLETATNHPFMQIEPFLGIDQIRAIRKQLGTDITGYQIRHYMDGVLDIIENYATIHEEEKLRKELTNFIFNRTSVTAGGKPMLKDLLIEEHIQFLHSVGDWKEAIQLASEPLIQGKQIETRYVEQMIEDVEKFGPYVVIAPGVAIPHSRPENGVNQLGMSLLKLEEGVSFGEKGDVTLIFILATIDNSLHLKALAQLSEILSDETKTEELFKCENKQSIMDLIKEGGTEND